MRFLSAIGLFVWTSAVVQSVTFSLVSNLCLSGSFLVLTVALGREHYGIFVFGLGVQSYLFLIGCLGLKPIVIRECLRRPDEIEATYTAHVILTGVSSMLIGALCSITVLAAPLTSNEKITITLLALGNVGACVNIQPFLDAFGRQGLSLALTAITEMLCFSLLLGVWQAGYLTLVVAGAIFAGKWGVNAGIHFAVFSWRVHRWQWRLCLANTRRITRSSLPLLFSGVVATIPISAGVVVVRFHHGNDDAALVGLGQQAATGFILITSFALRLLQPAILAFQGPDSHSSYRPVVLFCGSLAGAMLLAVAAGMAVIRWVLPSAFREAGMPVVLLLFAGYLNCVTSLGGTFLIARQQERIILMAHTIATVAYLTGCGLLVPAFSYNGAAVMSVIGTAIGLGVMGLRLWKDGRGQPMFSLAPSYGYQPQESLSHPLTTSSPKKDPSGDSGDHKSTPYGPTTPGGRTL